MVSVASQLIEEVTVHAQGDSLEDAREICADGTYFPKNLLTICLHPKGINILVRGRVLIPLVCNKLYHTYTYKRLLEDEPSGSKHVENVVKIKLLILKRCILLVYILRLHYNARCQRT